MSTSKARITLITITHVARRELDMDDATYRQMLKGIPSLNGETSTAKLSIKQLQSVTDAFKTRGFNIRPKKSAGKPRNFSSQAMPESMKKVEALLADMGLPWSYADSIVDRMFHIKKCAWLRKPDQVTALIASLHVELEKRSLLQSVKDALTEQGLTLEGIQSSLGLKPGWQRRRDTLKKVILHLAGFSE